MLDKELIKSKFQKGLLTYSDNATVQKQMAKKLAQYVSGFFEDVLEIGSYSGFLTCELVAKINFENYLAIDIVDSFSYIKNLNPKIQFLKADIEKVQLDKKFDLIVSSSSLQWCDDFNLVIKKLKSSLKQHGKLAIAVFGNKNLYQIKNAFNTSLNYPDVNEIKKYFSKNVKITEEFKTLQFDNPREILRHLKNTGVNSFRHNYTYSQIKERMNILEKKYNNQLTYHPIYIID